MSTRRGDNGDGWVFLVGLIFVSTSIGFLTSIAWGCLAFGVGLIFASILSYLNS